MAGERAAVGGQRIGERRPLDVLHESADGDVLGFGHVRSLGVGMLVLVAAGFVQNVAMIAMTAMLLAAAGDRFRGRVMGVRMLAVYGLPLGLLGSGFLIERIGYPPTITVATALGLLVTILIGIRWRASMWRRQPGSAASVAQGA